jgi:hypothetical protein
MAKRIRDSQLPPNDPPKFDLSKVGRSRRLAKQNKEYLDLLSIVDKARRGFVGEQARLKSKTAKESAKQLLRQLDLIFHLVFLPYVILTMMEGYASGYAEGLLSAFKGTERIQEKSKKASEKRVKITMQCFFALDVSGSLSRPWLFAVTLYVWTAFECLAGDLWATSLNHATFLGHRVLNSTSSEDTEKSGLSKRHIDVGLAARHGFDLRRSLGTILKSKFDFSGFDGIEAAYKQAFGTCGDLEKYIDTLKELEQVRHLIVHRGGVADGKFVKATKLKAKPDKMLSLKLSRVGSYMVSVTLSCVALLHVVDEWFAAQQQAPQ